LDIKPPHISASLKVLEEVGAIRRVKRGRTKVITVTPEGAYRGNIHNHAETVDRYKAEVFDLFSGQPVA
ncbi:MAG: ArsR family transcriptional regulator, partial [Acetobacteraceae bacterium]|nr:ArsR family transcriptional regulator [Acetobacteraceae bacterium]